MVKQGDIIMVNFDPTSGHEQRGYRPALIVSNNDFNRINNGLVKVVPITTNMKEFPLHIELPEGLAVYGKALLEHERSIDISSRSYKIVDTVPSDFLQEILELISFTY
ncbi:type II toxin-antitoxin system PemK/MazF family toxin [Lactobacillus gigeriorum]|uniref:mRNA interferase n=1 Tax=Lactobacillus gigeriorum DSM 23908 = CRBIP 24.85 TaxID=1423751 RepID=I7LFV3_9LACO|nr:type II toxin-antitoxin system PemK/MazF family toxin [Lactobacillus gigeriorum]KRN11994.1 hypothetical protein FC38_GL000397 [Lactobacillus gigeriorum DSM 23908 = CRBIP 24.85]CCI86993.1 PpGpp-regulated growth inhibitor [Lactobacillus gigeriorum DSM 23908 = CRBIP 24.85]